MGKQNGKQSSAQMGISYNERMIKIDKKNKWAVDLSIHIPIPSFSIALVGTEEDVIENTPLSWNQSSQSAAGSGEVNPKSGSETENKTGSVNRKKEDRNDSQSGTGN